MLTKMNEPTQCVAKYNLTKNKRFGMLICFFISPIYLFFSSHQKFLSHRRCYSINKKLFAKAKKFRLITVLFSLSLVISSCSSSATLPPPPIDTTSLSTLEGLNQKNANKKNKNQINPIRIDALKQTGLEVGAQGALAKRSQEIDSMLSKNSRYLDQIFNFNALMLPNNVLPPVLTEGDNSIHVANPQTIRVADKTYTIAKQAKFVSVPPTWHDYLWMSFTKPSQPSNSILPKNDAEETIWKQAVNDGWEQGTQQANAIFADNVARLQQDYKGMIIYRELVNKNMISTPLVAKTNLGVTGGGGSLSVNDRVKRLTSLPELNPNSQLWRSIISNENSKSPNNAAPTEDKVLPPEPDDMGIK